VHSPLLLKKQFEGKDGGPGLIKASYANFGNIPYGKSINGDAHYFVDNKDACGPIDRIERRGYRSVPIVVADRGHCTFVTKVRNI
jgi:hypothetical protein